MTKDENFRKIIKSETYSVCMFAVHKGTLKVHKIENFFGSEFEFCTISLLVLLKY
jgi:hypothetical protein